MWYPWISLRLRAFYLARKGCWMAHCSSVCCPAWTWISRSRSRLLLLYESEKWRLRNFWCREFSELMPLQRHRKRKKEWVAEKCPFSNRCFAFHFDLSGWDDSINTEKDRCVSAECLHSLALKIYIPALFLLCVLIFFSLKCVTLHILPFS